MSEDQLPLFTFNLVSKLLIKLTEQGILSVQDAQDVINQAKTDTRDDNNVAIWPLIDILEKKVALSVMTTKQKPQPHE
ncbi:TPA: hypothetical protein N3D39_002586 [Salmonella enterica subsp. enterica serovar Durban]|nr:hypothetical protein [Salmonella enterica]HCM2544502.1 hypothetical protein [Salmonella enterica subsp. enterica serovar Durban]HCM6316194.1 hypothetical protein [Salmonella enterica subsp. enterica serovar 14:z:e,n,x]